MKLLILGNHTCGNRGDSAILRGLLDAINILNPHTEVDVMSRYPVSSSWLLNRPVMGDPLFLQMKQHNSAAGVVGRVKSPPSPLSTPGIALARHRHWQAAQYCHRPGIH